MTTSSTQKKRRPTSGSAASHHHHANTPGSTTVDDVLSHQQFEENLDGSILYDEKAEQTQNISQAKRDLLQLGIELDDALIERLQKNLKIEKIFQVASKASQIIEQHKPPAPPVISSNGQIVNGQIINHVVPTSSSSAHQHATTPEVIYRNVSSAAPTTGAPGNANLNKAVPASHPHPIYSILNPKDFLHHDEKEITVLLQQLENRTVSIVEPQHRPAIDNLIDKYRVMYARCPERFICRLLGQDVPGSRPSSPTNHQQQTAAATSSSKPAHNHHNNAKTTARRSNTPTKTMAETQRLTAAKTSEQVLQMVLQKRYLTKSDFHAMLQRITPAHLQNQQEVFDTFFLLLCEQKTFTTGHHHSSAAAITKKKKDVVDLWAFLTLLKVANEESRRSYDGKTSKLASEIEFWKRVNGKTLPMEVNDHKGERSNYIDYSHDSVSSILQPNGTNVPIDTRKKDGRIQHVFSDPDRYYRINNKNVAELLGAENHVHMSKHNLGRHVMGTLNNEIVNACDIATALHSPNREKIMIDRRNKASHHTLPHNQLQTEHHLPIPPAQDMLDSRKVAYLLNATQLMGQQGKGGSNMRGKKPTPLLKEQMNNTSMAFALGNTEENENGNVLSPPPPPSNFEGTSLQLQNHQTQNLQRRMHMNSANSLYWDKSKQKPSVAAALGANTNFNQDPAKLSARKTVQKSH